MYLVSIFPHQRNVYVGTKISKKLTDVFLEVLRKQKLTTLAYCSVLSNASDPTTATCPYFFTIKIFPLHIKIFLNPLYL